MIELQVFGFTVASVKVDLGDIFGDHHTPTQSAPLRVQHRPPVVNTLVKAMSDFWVKRMMG
jgi:hypothetical protein